MIIRGSSPSPAQIKEAERQAKLAYLQSLQAAQFGIESFGDFVQRVRPRYWPVPPHLRPLYRLIERSRHEPVRAIISYSPRHGKSETLYLGLSYRILYDPACQNVYATYTSDLAKICGQKTRAIAGEIGIPLGKTSEVTVAGSSAAVYDWSTRQGGGLKSTSVGGGITGRGINGIMIIDDPIKGIEEARSLANRERVWRWIREDMLSRLQGGSSVILCMARWDEDDPAGRLLRGGSDWEKGLGEEWEHINLPAIHDGNFKPIDEREFPEKAQPLWTSINDRYPNNREAALAWYATIRKRSERAWWSLYQGIPRIDGNKVFRDDPGLPATYYLPFDIVGKRRMIMLDPAAKKTTSSDHNALGYFGMDGYGDKTIEIVDPKGRKFEVVNPRPSRMWVANIWKQRCAVTDAIRKARDWQRMYNVVVGIESDGTSANIPDILQRIEPGMKILPVHTHGKDKFTRAQPSAAAWNDGRILIPSTTDANGNQVTIGWDVDDFIRVLTSFTGNGDVEDDLVDIVAHAWLRLFKPWQPRDNFVRGTSY